MSKLNDGLQNNRLIIAVVLSLCILLGYEFLMSRFAPPAPLKPVAEQVTGRQAAPTAEEQEAEAATEPAVVETTPAAAPVELSNTRMRVRINLKGSRVERWVLRNYSIDGGAEKGYVQLKTNGPYAEYMESGWQGLGIDAPNEQAVWQVKNVAADAVVLTWRNGSGQVFTRMLALRPDSYVLEVTDTVANGAELPVSMFPYAQIHRAGGNLPGETSSFVNHLGPMGVTGEEDDRRLYEEDFDDVGDGRVKTTGSGGWWGLTSQYFLSAIVPLGDAPTSRWWKQSDVGDQTVTTASVQGETMVVPPGGEIGNAYLLYAGPKQEEHLLTVGHDLERAIDWGWFRLLARPFHQALLWFYSWVGSWGIAILLLTLMLKIVTFPLANKSYHAMAKMKKLQPEMEALRERYKDDQQALAMEMMGLYRQHKVNPLSGCWPMLIQIPIFFAMYKVVLLSFELRHAPIDLFPFSYWVHDLSVADPFFILPVLMGASMWFQMRLNPPPADPAQAMVFKWMPVIFTFMFLWFPAALVWYWLVNNVFSIAQQVYIMRKDKAL